MAKLSLVDTANNIRKLAVIVLIVAFVVIGIDTVSKWLNSSLSPFFSDYNYYLDADGAFGDVAGPYIPSQAIADDNNPSFTIDGAFPAFPQTVLIYQIEKPRQKLDTIENAVDTSKTLNFINNYRELSNEELVWENTQLTRSLNFNKVSQQWQMRTQYFLDTQALKPKTIQQDLTVYTSAMATILANLGFDEQGLRTGYITAKYAKLGLNGLFTSPTSAASADYVAIDVFRKLSLSVPKSSTQLPENLQGVELPPKLDGKVYTLDPRVGSLHMIVSDRLTDPTKDIYEFDFINYEYNYNYGVYRIVSAQEAWDRVRNGNGALVQITLQTADYFAPNQQFSVGNFAVDAKQAELAYWEPDVWTGFLYPIYVLRGRATLTDGRLANFVFYVDALWHG